MSRFTPRDWRVLAFWAALAAVAPWLDGFWLSLLTMVFYYALLGIAWNVAMGFTGLLSIGHALYVGLGAYTTVIVLQKLGLSPWVGIPAGALVAALAGAMITWLGFRFAVRGVFYAMLTIAFLEIVRILFDNWSFVGGTGGLFVRAIAAGNQPLLSLRGDSRFFYYAFLVLLVFSYWLTELLAGSRLGYWCLAIRENETAARAVGVPALRVKVAAGAISAALTGLAGGLFALLQGSLFPDSIMGMQLSIELMIAPLVGGLGTLFGPVLGAFVIVPVLEFSSQLGQDVGIYGLNLLVYGVILLVIIKFLPEGIWPRALLLLRRGR
jgi:branched-chain amino acid transport system permease protein